jgi:hypothetical protein
MTLRYGVYQETHLLASFDVDSSEPIPLASTARKSLEGRYGPLRAQTMPFTSIAPLSAGDPLLPPSLR